MEYKLSDICDFVKEKIDVSELNSDTYILFSFSEGSDER